MLAGAGVEHRSPVLGSPKARSGGLSLENRSLIYKVLSLTLLLASRGNVSPGFTSAEWREQALASLQVFSRL